jgi:cell fate regulator YaaT (PSP1 superfamily)
MRKIMPDTNSLVVSKLLYNCEACFFEVPDYDVKRGDLVVLETDNGPEIATISGLTRYKPEKISIKKILRKTTDEDLKKLNDNKKREKDAFQVTLEKIKKYNLDMKLVNIHYFFDNNKIIFNFTSDGRVDFRELVKDLASIFKKRIELRQIGARDEAKIITGSGICGRNFCCNAIKNELQPVTIKMAKDQNLTLNSSKISGACGRLLCCLAYEHEAYCEIKRKYPSEGSILEYEGKQVTLSEINILKMMATLRTKDQMSIQVSVDELKKATKPIQNKHNKKNTG